MLDASGDLSLVQSKKNSNFGYWSYANSFTYNAAGAVTSMQLGNGRWESTQFNSRLQPTQIALGTVQNGYDKLKLEYSYGDWNGTSIDATKNNGNIVKQIITVPTVGSYNGFIATQKYYYDSLNRIDDATEDISGQTWRQDFTYDRYGNRNFNQTNTTMPSFSNPAVTNPTISGTNNRITSSGYNYDSSGNTTFDASLRKFTYDAENRQTKVESTNSSQVVMGTVGEYSYDGDGKRVKKYVPSTGETTIFVYDTAAKLVAEYSTIVASTNDAKVAYVTNDHLGSPRINTDANGAVTARHDYHPFGEKIATSQRVPGIGYADDTIRKQFTSYERDTETGLDFAQARYYSNNHGRFISVDPINLTLERLVDPQRLNLYIYSLNNPLKYTDSNGEDVVLKDGMTKQQVDELVNELAKEYLATQGVYDFLNNEESDESTKLILNNGDLSTTDDKGRITYGQTTLKGDDITITFDFKRRDEQQSKNVTEKEQGQDNLEEPPPKKEMVREELSHAIDASVYPKEYLQAVKEDKTFQGKREDKPSEKRRIAIEKTDAMNKPTSKEQVKNLDEAKKQIRDIVDYKNYKFAKKN